MTPKPSAHTPNKVCYKIPCHNPKCETHSFMHPSSGSSRACDCEEIGIGIGGKHGPSCASQIPLTSIPSSPHTPTPWKHWEACEGYIITDELNRFVAKVTDSTGKHGIQDIPNAAFIVRAVNAHEELLRAAKHAFYLIKESGFNSGLTEDMFDKTLSYLEKTIAKAEGESNG